jgi:hypothetical protein
MSNEDETIALARLFEAFPVITVHPIKGNEKAVMIEEHYLMEHLNKLARYFYRAGLAASEVHHG